MIILVVDVDESISQRIRIVGLTLSFTLDCINSLMSNSHKPREYVMILFQVNQ